jgi:hypothetical protein
MASKAAWTFFQAFPGHSVTIEDLTGQDPVELLVGEARAVSPHDVVDLSMLA